MVLLLMLAAPACRPLATGPAGTGGAGSGGGTSGQSLVGTWRRTLILQTPDDITTSETTWLFAPGGSCERIVATTTVSAGYTDTVRSPCGWSVAGTTVTIRYDGAGTAQFTWAVQGSTLFLNGVPFQRA